MLGATGTEVRLDQRLSRFVAAFLETDCFRARPLLVLVAGERRTAPSAEGPLQQHCGTVVLGDLQQPNRFVEFALELLRVDLTIVEAHHVSG